MFEKLREKLIPKNQNSRAYRMQFARSLHGKSIRYVTERDENAKEHVIGHRGSVSLGICSFFRTAKLFFEPMQRLFYIAR